MPAIQLNGTLIGSCKFVLNVEACLTGYFTRFLIIPAATS
jgi:hypothetical protein